MYKENWNHKNKKGNFLVSKFSCFSFLMLLAVVVVVVVVVRRRLFG